MKKFNFIYLFLAFVGVLSMTSCEHKYADYTPGPQDQNMGVYLPSAASFEVTAEDTSVNVVVGRNDASEAATVSVRAAEITESGLFELPSSVSFEAGATEANYTITFEAGTLEVGKPYQVTVQLDQAEATQYAISEYTYTIMIPEPWVSLGEGIYFDDCLCYILGDPSPYIGVGTYVEFQQHAVETNRLRVVNPYGPKTIAAMWGGLPSWMLFTGAETTYIEFDITDPNDVKIVGPAENLVELSDGTNTYYVYMMDISIPDNGYDLGFFWDPAYPITLQNGILKYPTEGMALSAFSGGQYLGDFSEANTTGFMQYYLPGVDFVNYDLMAAYAGMKVEADNATTSAIIDFAYGGDVESFKFTLVDGVVDDATAIVEAIVAGSEEYTIYEGSIDEYSYTIPVDGTGMKSVVAVPYAGGEAKTDYALVYSFYFVGIGGNEIPEVDIEIRVGSVVDITGNPAYETNFPSNSSMCIYMGADASQLTAISGFVGGGIPEGMTNEEVLAQAGQDFSDFLPEMAADGYALAVYKDLTEGQAYDVILGFTTIYGKVQTYRTTYTPTAAATPARRLNVEPRVGALNVEMTKVRF
jgi:hypothetical protein